MVSVLASSVVDRGFDPRSDQTKDMKFMYDSVIPVNLWELLGGGSPTNSSKGEILRVAFKRTKLYLVVER